ncbi:MAG TPA: hypothetical protein VGO00_22065 [Kofleriaceae bacterium]|nr:hypothetical protein [Kofleriaceae bacterium]
MADLVLRIRVDPVTGKRMLVVDYASDSDALPIEHEDEHRRLASKLVDGGLTGESIEVTRAADTSAGESAGTSEPVAIPTATKR